MTLLSIRHATCYRYRRPVAFGEHRMYLRPMESFDQQVVAFDLDISPEPERLRFSHDMFGNAPIIAAFGRRAKDLRIEARSLVRHRPHTPFSDGGDEDLAALPLAYAADETADLSRLIERHRPDPEGLVEAWARRFLRRTGANGARRVLTEMTQAVRSDFRYAKRLLGDALDPTETIRTRQGSCRDFALLMMEAARSLGFAAQFVTGYIHEPERTVGGLRRVGGGHTHAWLRIYLPREGWADFDPTNGIIGGADLIRVAVARDPRQAAPLAGTFYGAEHDHLAMDVEVEVVEAMEHPAAAITSSAVQKARRRQARAIAG